MHVSRDVWLVLLGAVFGGVPAYVVSRISAWRDRQAAERASEAAREAAWALTPTSVADVLLLRNVGDAGAEDVRLVVPSHVALMKNFEPGTIGVGAVASVHARFDRDKLWSMGWDVPTVEVIWVSHRGDRRSQTLPLPA